MKAPIKASAQMVLQPAPLHSFICPFLTYRSVVAHQIPVTFSVVLTLELDSKPSGVSGRIVRSTLSTNGREPNGNLSQTSPGMG